MPMRNVFDFGSSYLPKGRRNYFSGAPADPTASNTRRFMENVSFQQPEAQAPPEERPQGMEWGNWMQDMRDAYMKEGPAQSAYREHLGTIPQYQGTSKWGKLGAALVGGAEGYTSGSAARGFQAAQEAAQTPYRRELENWGMKEQALGRQAGLEEKQSGQRIQFMQQARQMAKDEREYRKWMDDYDYKVWQEQANQDQDAATRARWDRQDLETYTDENGDLWERMPGSSGPGRRVSKTLEGAKFGETKRSNRVTEGISGMNAQTARGQLGVAQGNLELGKDREYRISSQPMDPRAQSSARASALTRAASSNPAWSGFVDMDTGNVNPPVVRDATDPKWQEYQRFLREVERQEGSIFSRPRYNQTIEY